MLQLKKAIRTENLRQPFKQALETASQIGADGIEINAWTELRASEMSQTGIRHLRKMLADRNLQVAALHFPTLRGMTIEEGLEQRLDAIKSTMNLAYQLGCSVVVNSIGPIPESAQAPGWTTMLQALSDLGAHSHKAGAWLAASTGIDGGPSFKKLLDALPPHSLMIDFDPGDLIINGHSPNEAMQLLGPHIASFRAHDAVIDQSQGRGIEVQLGRGSVDWPALLGLLEENAYQGFLIVERNTDEQPILQCSQAMEYLTRLF